MKKKIVTLCLSAALVATLLIGGTLAYFTDSTQVVENTFTVGNVDITLDEAKVEFDETTEEYVAQEDRTEAGVQYKEIFPGAVLPKDPTITVKNTGNEKAYIAAKVTVTGADLKGLLGAAGDATDCVGLTGFVTGGVSTTEVEYKADYEGLGDGWLCQSDAGQYYLIQKVEDNTYTFEYYFEDEKAAADKIVLFEQLNLPTSWTNTQIADLGDMVIDVKAYAVQEDGFENVYEAFADAFPSGLN